MHPQKFIAKINKLVQNNLHSKILIKSRSTKSQNFCSPAAVFGWRSVDQD